MRVLPSRFVITTKTCYAIHRAQLQVDLRKYPKATALQRAELEDRRATLFRRIQRFRDTQSHLMPDLRAKLGVSKDEFNGTRSNAQSIPLHLPSSLLPTTRSQACSAALINTERQLREAEAFDALEGLRNRLRTKTFMTRYKTSNISGQRSNTRARVLLATVDLRIFLLKHRYRRARLALMSLVGEEDWRNLGYVSSLRDLKDEDVRGLGDAALKEGERASMDYARQQAEAGTSTLRTIRILKTHSESNRTLSWIWTSVPLTADGSDPGLNDGAFFSLCLLSPIVMDVHSCSSGMGEGKGPRRALDRRGPVSLRGDASDDRVLQVAGVLVAIAGHCAVGCHCGVEGWDPSLRIRACRP